jgi:hypothetical protein
MILLLLFNVVIYCMQRLYFNPLGFLLDHPCYDFYLFFIVATPLKTLKIVEGSLLMCY